MYKPLIAIDVDGPLADFRGATLKGLNLCGFVRDYNFGDVRGFDPIEAQHLWHSKGFVLGLDVIDGAVAAINELRGIGHVIFVTSPMFTPYWFNERHQWLALHFGADSNDVVVTKNKWLIRSPDFIIDDLPKNLICHIPESRMLWHMNHNELENRCEPRIHDWAQAVHYIKMRMHALTSRVPNLGY
jgi:5'(3')-deoxyribonucleotidase